MKNTYKSGIIYLQPYIIKALFAIFLFVSESQAEDLNFEQRLNSLKEYLNTQDKGLETDFERRLRYLKGLLRQEGIPDDSTPHDRFEALSKDIKVTKNAPAPSRPVRPVSFGAGYWLTNISGMDNDIADLYNTSNSTIIGQEVRSPGSITSSSIVVDGEYHLANNKSLCIDFWALNAGSSKHKIAQPSTVYAALDASDYYAQNYNQWGLIPQISKSAGVVDVNTDMEGFWLDVNMKDALLRTEDDDLGWFYGIRYVQLDFDQSVRYSSSVFPLYDVRSEVKNTLLGPSSGLYYNENLTKTLKLSTSIGLSAAWNHTIGERAETDHTIPQFAEGGGDTIDKAIITGDMLMGMRYSPLDRLSLNLSYKATFLNRLPVEIRTKGPESPRFIERDILIHGLIGGITYSF